MIYIRLEWAASSFRTDALRRDRVISLRKRKFRSLILLGKSFRR